MKKVLIILWYFIQQKVLEILGVGLFAVLLGLLCRYELAPYIIIGLFVLMLIIANIAVAINRYHCKYGYEDEQ